MIINSMACRGWLNDRFISGPYGAFQAKAVGAELSQVRRDAALATDSPIAASAANEEQSCQPSEASIS